VQRISDTKCRAKESGVELKDGDVQTACQQSCPAQAIVFGDLNDPKSAVSQARTSGRQYRLLPEINAQQSVGYLRIVRNRAETGQEGAS
jgi:molybdopterin-containing oxidoreductase family iron-sulfur binding subunit